MKSPLIFFDFFEHLHQQLVEDFGVLAPHREVVLNFLLAQEPVLLFLFEAFDRSS